MLAQCADAGTVVAGTTVLSVDGTDIEIQESPIKKHGPALNQWRNTLVHADITLAETFEDMGTDRKTFLFYVRHLLCPYGVPVEAWEDDQCEKQADGRNRERQ